MAEKRVGALSDVLDRLESAAHDRSISVQEVVETLGKSSFAALMLIFSLFCVSPASAVPGITSFVATIVFLLALQMLVGRECLWLPGFIARRRMSTARICKGIGWLRNPVRFVEGFLRERFTVLLRRPWLFLHLFLILGLTLFMPFMEVIPASGSIASAMIALFAAGLLTKDGVLMIASVALLSAVPVVVWQLGVSF